MHVCICACGGQRTTSSIVPQTLSNFLRQCLFWSGTQPSRLGWLASNSKTLTVSSAMGLQVPTTTQESNPGPQTCKAEALQTELSP